MFKVECDIAVVHKRFMSLYFLSNYDNITLPSPPSPEQTHTPSQTAAAAAPDIPETPLPSSRNSRQAAGNR